MKIVINTCFGGFSLSPAGERAYLARKGKTAFFYAEDRESATRLGDRDLFRVSESEVESCFTMVYTSTRDFGERVDHVTFWGKDNPDWYFCGSDVERDDPDLVAVVEELGQEAAGTYAMLAVVEVPDDVQWELDEYDGKERVTE